MKNLTLTSAVFALGMGITQASINWSSTSGTALRDTDGTPLFAGINTTGFFVQLIRDVDGDGPDPLNPSSPIGVSGDDVVMDVSFIGSFSALGVVDGRLNPQSTLEPHVQGATYYMRFWNAKSRQATSVLLGAGNESTPIPDFDPLTGINPATNKPLRYGDSETVTINDPTNINVQYAFSGPAFNFTTNMPVVVPEPTTAALLSMGAAGVAMALKRRRQIS